jgi:hypothetical protein
LFGVRMGAAVMKLVGVGVKVAAIVEAPAATKAAGLLSKLQAAEGRERIPKNAIPHRII